MTIEAICSADSASPAAAPSSPSAELSTHEICAEIERLVEVERRTESLLCDHLAELADRFDRRAPELGAYADIYQFSRLRFGMSVRRVRERVRIGRALRGLPLAAQAFVNGELGSAKVREVTRVAGLAAAGPDSEAIWLATASELPLRVLERRVAEAGESESGGDSGHEKTRDPAEVRWATATSIELRLNLPAAAWALLERAMEGARQKSESSLSDAEALEAVARDALASQADTRFYDAAGDPIEQAPVTPRGHLMEVGISEAASKLLKVMSAQDSWHPDELQEQCELRVSDISCALIELELSGLVHNGVRGYHTVPAALHA